MGITMAMGGTHEHATVIERLRAAGIVATLRAPSAKSALSAVGALIDGGITAIEITYSTPAVPDLLRTLAARFGDRILLGAGTITRPGQAGEAAAAGARFLVAPGCPEPIVAEMTATGVLACPGALTPTEVMQALACGAAMVKIFPAGLVGPGLLAALRGPFPDLLTMPTGGISAANLGDWLAAGALAVGASGELCPRAAMSSGDWTAIRHRAEEFTAALTRARAAG